VHTPATGRTHWAARGLGAFVREPGGSESRIAAARFRDDDEGLTLVGSASHQTPATDEFVKARPLAATAGTQGQGRQWWPPATSPRGSLCDRAQGLWDLGDC